MQIFPKKLNLLPLVAAVIGAGAGIPVVFGAWYYFSPKNLQVGYAPEQPIHYSHKLHAGELGIDCRYCHANVEDSFEAMVPPTQTCMGCHNVVKKDSPMLEELRKSWETGMPVEWVRVHKLPDHAFFDHSVHVTAGVGCVSCHGRVDQMEVVTIQEPISMAWCLDCHRDPGPHLRPKDQITNMSWEKQPGDEAALAEVQASLMPPEHCSGCHR
ncbi:MAG: cytochrome c3 family protein [Myxococcales bacterium]|nr:cytochrome c3 family protein [Myxococcales bacterium]